MIPSGIVFGRKIVSVVPIRKDLPANLPIGLPAIRTPDQFREVDARIQQILDGMRSHAILRHLADIAEIKNLREALDASPFIKDGDLIVRKGFLPRSVA